MFVYRIDKKNTEFLLNALSSRPRRLALYNVQGTVVGEILRYLNIDGGHFYTRNICRLVGKHVTQCSYYSTRGVSTFVWNVSYFQRVTDQRGDGTNKFGNEIVGVAAKPAQNNRRSFVRVVYLFFFIVTEFRRN